RRADLEELPARAEPPERLQLVGALLVGSGKLRRLPLGERVAVGHARGRAFGAVERTVEVAYERPVDRIGEVEMTVRAAADAEHAALPRDDAVIAAAAEGTRALPAHEGLQAEFDSREQIRHVSSPPAASRTDPARSSRRIRGDSTASSNSPGAADRRGSESRRGTSAARARAAPPPAAPCAASSSPRR